MLSCTFTPANSDDPALACPAAIADQTVAVDIICNCLWDLFSTEVAFPAGATLTVEYTIAPVWIRTTCPAQTESFDNQASVSLAPAEDYLTSTFSSTATVASAPCADLVISKGVSEPTVSFGESVSYTLTVSNASPQAATNVLVSDPLPAGFRYSSASCAPVADAECGAVNYDTATRTVSMVAPRVGPTTGRLVLTVEGTAGPVADSYGNTATVGAAPGSSFFDPLPDTNSSTIVLRVLNTASPVQVTKTITGDVPAGGLPGALTFTGTIECDDQPVVPWSVTIPAGATSATSDPALLWDGVGCVITEDPSPAAPAGFSWAGPAVVSPDSIDELGPETPITVASTSELVVDPTTSTTVPETTVPETTVPPTTVPPTSTPTTTIAPPVTSPPTTVVGGLLPATR